MTEPSHRVPGWLATAAAIGWRSLVVVAAVLALALAMRKLMLVVMPVVVALMLATLLASPARRLERRGIPRPAAAFAVTAGAAVAGTAAIALLVPAITAQLSGAGEELAEGFDQLVQWIVGSPLPVTQQQVDAVLDQAGQQLRDNLAEVSAGVLAGAVAVIELIAGILLSIVLLFFFLKDADLINAWLLDWVTPGRREDARAAAQRAWGSLGGFIRGAALVALVDATAIAVGLWITGVPLVLPLAALTFIGGFFPIVGAIVAGFVAVVVALVTRGVVHAVITLGVVVGVQQLDSNVLQPVVLGRAVHVHPVVILLSITAGGVLAGIIGAFLAVPLAAVVAAVASELRQRRRPERAREEAAAEPA